MSRLADIINKLNLQKSVGVTDPNRSPASIPEDKPVMLDQSMLPESQNVNPDLLNRIKQYENSIKKGYNPETDMWMPHESLEGGAPTIAYGDKLHTGKYTPQQTRKILEMGITGEQADQALKRNIFKAQQDAQDIMERKGIKNLDPVQKEALTEMVFQMGKKGVLDFPNMIKALQRGDLNNAYVEALDSEWARQDSPQRAKDVAKRLRYGKLAHKLSKK